MKRPQLPRRHRKPRYSTRLHSYIRTPKGAMLAAGSTLGDNELEFENEPTTKSVKLVPDRTAPSGLKDKSNKKG